MLINYIQSLFRRLVIFAANLFVITFQKTTELRAIIFLVVLSSFLCYLFSLGILFVDDYNSYDAFAIKNTFQDNNVTPPGINHPPVANAGQNQIVNESNIVTLNGLASDPDPNDEGKLVYLWKQLSGPGVNLSNNTSPNPSFTAPMVSSDRELRFSVIAIDENGATSKPTNVIITVKHLNLPPIAKAGENQTISPGDVVTLDGSKSSDPENDPLRYSWIQTSGPRVKLGGATNSIASFTVPSNISSETDLIFALTVADSRNASSIDNVKITSRPAPSFNKPPVANAGEDMMVNAGEIVKLNGTGSKDPDGKNITSYVWEQIVGSPIELKGGNTSIPTFTAPSNVTSNTALVFQLTVKDDKNATSISPVKITVKPANHSPSSNSGLDMTVNASDVVTLDGSKSSDPDNDPLTYTWKQLSGPNITLNSIDKPFAIFTAPKDISSDTDMIFELTVTDSKNATSKDSVKVTVKYIPPPNQPPVANAGQDQTVNSGDIVNLDGSGSTDPDGKIVSYSWKQSSGPSITLNNANSLKSSFTAPTVSSDAELKFSLTITDDEGRISNPSIVTVTVTAEASEQPSLPTTSSAANETIFNNETPITGVPSSDQTQLEASTKYSFVTKWGSEGTGDGQFNTPEGIAIDSSGNVYVADTGNDRIQKFNGDGNFITKWGSQGDGDGQFNNPSRVAIDSSGNVYVTEWAINHVQKFDSNGKFITKFGSEGTGDGQFNGPEGIAIDSSGNVYVSEYNNNRIQKFDSNGNFITKWGSKGTGDGQFNTPAGVATDSSGNVYVAEYNNNRIQKFDSNGKFITKWGSNGTGDRDFFGPQGIAVDSSGNVYVADTGNDRIQKFDGDGNFITKWGSFGSGDGQFNEPDGVAPDSSDNVYVADTGNHRIQKFAPSSKFEFPFSTLNSSNSAIHDAIQNFNP